MQEAAHTVVLRRNGQTLQKGNEEAEMYISAAEKKKRGNECPKHNVLHEEMTNTSTLVDVLASEAS